MKLSLQAIGAIMFALQNSLMEQSDIVPVFQGWDLFMKNGEVFVDNVPRVEINVEGDESEEYEEIVDFLTEPDGE